MVAPNRSRKIRCIVVTVPDSNARAVDCWSSGSRLPQDRLLQTGSSTSDPFVARLIKKLQEEVRRERHGRFSVPAGQGEFGSDWDVEEEEIEVEDWYGVYDQATVAELTAEAEWPWRLSGDEDEDDWAAKEDREQYLPRKDGEERDFYNHKKHKK